MMNWLISANGNKYDHAASFAENNNIIDWTQGRIKYNIGDVIYIYCTKPIQKIMYKCVVDEINIKHDRIRNDSTYWFSKDDYERTLDGNFMRLRLLNQIDNSAMQYSNLRLNGLKAAPQGPKLLTGNLLNYIENNFNDINQSDYFPEMITGNEISNIFEGAKTSVFVNKYERSSFARARCIEHNGVSCKVCEMNFFDTYGELGKDFIHVHHIVPLNQIAKEYIVNHKEDLIPVCPNCHAMLHRKINGREVTIEELRNIFLDKKSSLFNN